MKILDNIKTFFHSTISYSNYREICTKENYLMYTQGYVDVETSLFFNRSKKTVRFLYLNREWLVFDTGEPLPYQRDISILKESYSKFLTFEGIKQCIIERERATTTNDN